MDPEQRRHYTEWTTHSPATATLFCTAISSVNPVPRLGDRLDRGQDKEGCAGFCVVIPRPSQRSVLLYLQYLYVCSICRRRPVARSKVGPFFLLLFFYLGAVVVPTQVSPGSGGRMPLLEVLAGSAMLLHTHTYANTRTR